jgi:hypothetical protein
MENFASGVASNHIEEIESTVAEVSAQTKVAFTFADMKRSRTILLKHMVCNPYLPQELFRRVANEYDAVAAVAVQHKVANDGAGSGVHGDCSEQSYSHDSRWGVHD